MNEQKNLLLAMALTLIVLVAFDFLYGSRQGPAPATDTAPAGETAVPEAPVPQTEAGGTAAAAAGTVTLDRQGALRASPRIAIDTPRLQGSIALVGGIIDDLTLKDYRVAVDSDERVTLLQPKGTANAYYVALGWTARPELGLDLPGPETHWLSEDTTLTPDHPVVLHWVNKKGIAFERRIEVDDDYMFTITDSVRNPGGAPVILAPYGLISRHGEPKVRGYYILQEGPLGVFDGKLEEASYKDLREDGPFTADSVGGWLGITDKYWLTALVPQQDVPFKGRFLHVANGAPRYQADYLEEEMVIPAGAEKNVRVQFFAGAKEVDLISRYEKAYGIQLFDRAIDWGWFIFLTKPIFYVLDWLNGLTGSFALAILLLTVLVKAIMYPLANKSYVSMSKMKLVQPKMKKLQERYKDDKVRLQQEMMELYRKEKINPLSGCLPTIVQIPVFFALYKVLFVTIEMRHQPGFFWVKDLSAADHLLVTNLFGLIPWDPPGFLAIGVWPLLMSLAMYVQMQLNPSAGDPTQQKVLKLMPFIFLFVMARFPAGLVIYWTWNTLLSILQQWVIMRRHGVPIAAND
ncbi:MAG: membrane protein insertase YidC [Alphaproteobacteria bacterium]|nr:MAG: membrane protein insertase YidC [Alphaproteobacteria bacterium]